MGEDDALCLEQIAAYCVHNLSIIPFVLGGNWHYDQSNLGLVNFSYHFLFVCGIIFCNP